jgi:hypothetical protein
VFSKSKDMLDVLRKKLFIIIFNQNRFRLKIADRYDATARKQI